MGNHTTFGASLDTPPSDTVHTHAVMLSLALAPAAFSLTTNLAAPQLRALPKMQLQEEAAAVAEAQPPAPVFSVRDLPGITAPLGFFDPLDFCGEASEGKIKFYREVELKHGRVAMLASLGFLVGEQFHPLFGGKIDVPSYIAFQETPLQTFWPAVILFISILEVFSVFSFNTPFGGEPWTIRSDYENGDLGFDPLGMPRHVGLAAVASCKIDRMMLILRLSYRRSRICHSIMAVKPAYDDRPQADQRS